MATTIRRRRSRGPAQRRARAVAPEFDYDIAAPRTAGDVPDTIEFCSCGDQLPMDRPAPRCGDCDAALCPRCAGLPGRHGCRS